MKKLLVCSCVADDKYAPVSMYLMHHRPEDVVAGVESYAAGMDAEIMYLLPEGETVDGLKGQVRYCVPSPTLTNPGAVAQALKGNRPLPVIQDDFMAIYEEKEVLVVTPEAAYGIKNGFNKGFLAVNAAGETVIKEVAIGEPLITLLDVTEAKAVLLGGLKGRFLASEELSGCRITAADLFSSVTIYNRDTCMVDVCRKLLEEAWKSSCGKCVLCREGTSQFRQIVTEMTTGKAKMTDIDLLGEVGELVCAGSYCPFGQNMPRPLLSALGQFADEFEEHIKKKTCRCGMCYPSKSTYVILPDKCAGCGDCMDACGEDAIEGKRGFIHMIDQDMCEQCGKCVSACEEEAIVAVNGKLPRLPKRLTKVGKF